MNWRSLRELKCPLTENDEIEISVPREFIWRTRDPMMSAAMQLHLHASGYQYRKCNIRDPLHRLEVYLSVIAVFP